MLNQRFHKTAEKITAIVVDSDKDTASVFTDYLKLYNFQVLGMGYNGKDAIELFNKHNPDLVFLDYKMPEYDGEYALSNIRTRNPNALIIMMSLDKDINADEAIMKLKPSAILYKPFNMELILKKINQLLAIPSNSTR